MTLNLTTTTTHFIQLFSFRGTAYYCGGISRRPDYQVLARKLSEALVTARTVFVANRVRDILSQVSAEHWRYVAINANRANRVSWGLLPQDLLKNELWWQGPPWLKQPLDIWPWRPDINLERELHVSELPSVVQVLQTTEDLLWKIYSSFDRLSRTVAWCQRFANNTKARGSALAMAGVKLAFLGMARQTRVIGMEVANVAGVCDLSDRPNQPASFNLSTRKFGELKPVFWNVQPTWFHKWPWLHYDQVEDKMFC